jgi:NAD(P)-dependent dehydrogenase (short-subunit alcohol dehydrogenase family)
MSLSDEFLASRTFTQADQQWFAALSGDNNPMHLDHIAARRTPAGFPVVHGMHTLLWTLNCIAAANPAMAVPTSIRTNFTTFLLVGQTACLGKLTGLHNRRAIVSASGLATMILELRYGTRGETKARDIQVAPADILAPERPFELEPADMEMQRGAVGFATAPKELEAAFPAAAAWLGSRRLAALTCCTRLVGMVCPGLHSIFHRADIDLADDRDPSCSIAFAVTSVDLRFRNVRLAVTGGGISGTLVTAARHPPTSQPSMADVAGTVEPGSFGGAKALVVGGSRGLGELTAKILAAGGADVIVTYAIGCADAQRVAAEIIEWGGNCEVLQYNALRPAAMQLTDRIGSITHCYYFATPMIFQPSAPVFMKERFHSFLQFYVDGFYELCAAFQAHTISGVRVFYPSSIFVSDRPVGMTEYAMAKAAGEVLCDEINRRLTSISVVSSRLPRMATDQTVTLLSEEAATSIDVMLPLVQRVQGAARSEMSQ